MAVTNPGDAVANWKPTFTGKPLADNEYTPPSENNEHPFNTDSVVSVDWVVAVVVEIVVPVVVDSLVIVLVLSEVAVVVLWLVAVVVGVDVDSVDCDVVGVVVNVVKGKTYFNWK